MDTFTEQEPEGGNRLRVDYELDLGHVGLKYPKRSPGRDITGGSEKLKKEAEVRRARLVLEIKSGFSTLAAQDYVRILVSRHNADFDRRHLRQRLALGPS